MKKKAPRSRAFVRSTRKIDAGRMDINIRFGSRLRSFRSGSGITQVEFANLLNVSRPYLSLVENGYHSATLPMIQVMAKGLRVSISELLDGL